MLKFRLKNMDCAACAAKLEHGLNKADGVEDAVVDFVNQTLFVQTGEIQHVVKTARAIDPKVELIPKSDRTIPPATGNNNEGINFKKEVGLLVAATVLFGWLLINEHKLAGASLFTWPMLIVLAAYVMAGGNVIANAFQTIRRGTLFDENVLMVIATGGAIGIQAYSEAVGVMIFFKIGELLQAGAVSRSRRSIHALLAARPDQAVVKTTQGLRTVTPESVAVGDILVVKPGQKIPLDGNVLEGQSHLDTSALTGEPVPLSVKPGDPVMAGQISTTGALTVEVTRPFRESSIARVMDLVENATARKARTEKFITTFARYYTPAVVLIAAAIAFLPPVLTGASYQTWIYRALVLLVISCPCALVISIPLGYFGGLGRASRQGILVKGSNYIDVLAAVKTVVFDKTGTLTKGVFRVKDVVSRNGFSKDQLLEFAAAAEFQSNHPIATSILAFFAERGGRLNESQILAHTVHAGQGVTARYDKRSILVGNDSFLHLKAIDHDQCEFDDTVAHIAVDGQYAGHITIGDELRPDALDAIQALRDQGVDHIAMLTGDNDCAARAVADKLGLDRYDADLLPEEKVTVFEKIGRDRPNGKIAFVGDGINDAPVIARADVGLAMGALGSDAAVETADVVLMTDTPRKMAEAVAIAKQTRRVVWQNILLAFAVKGVFISFGAFGLATMWEAVFADVGTALLAVANATRILRG
ncbi:MAG: cadmium-translocating P-type ATPase [Desulfobacteraceae bacterium]|nr:cadmium-translocating P-type ATPase [Desulfobacteraceae bacterium]MBC2753580.1 cadmium-translocating P-type ATPase [Desulfobacteraceae bacterium]